MNDQLVKNQSMRQRPDGLTFTDEHKQPLTQQERDALRRASEAESADDAYLVPAIYKMCYRKPRIHGQVVRWRTDKNACWAEIVVRLGKQVNPFLTTKERK